MFGFECSQGFCQRSANRPTSTCEQNHLVAHEMRYIGSIHKHLQPNPIFSTSYIPARGPSNVLCEAFDKCFRTGEVVILRTRNAVKTDRHAFPHWLAFRCQRLRSGPNRWQGYRVRKAMALLFLENNWTARCPRQIPRMSLGNTLTMAGDCFTSTPDGSFTGEFYERSDLVADRRRHRGASCWTSDEGRWLRSDRRHYFGNSRCFRGWLGIWFAWVGRGWRNDRFHNRCIYRCVHFDWNNADDKTCLRLAQLTEHQGK